RVALDLRHLAVLDIDELRAADGAVGADRFCDRLRLVDPRRQCPRVRRLHGSAQPERVSSTKLPGDRPPGDQLSKRHFSTGFLAEWDVFKPNVGRYNYIVLRS